jgi:hypothetical protein
MRPLQRLGLKSSIFRCGDACREAGSVTRPVWNLAAIDEEEASSAQEAARGAGSAPFLPRHQP